MVPCAALSMSATSAPTTGRRGSSRATAGRARSCHGGPARPAGDAVPRAAVPARCTSRCRPPGTARDPAASCGRCAGRKLSGRRRRGDGPGRRRGSPLPRAAGGGSVRRRGDADVHPAPSAGAAPRGWRRAVDHAHRGGPARVARRRRPGAARAVRVPGRRRGRGPRWSGSPARPPAGADRRRAAGADRGRPGRPGRLAPGSPDARRGRRSGAAPATAVTGRTSRADGCRLDAHAPACAGRSPVADARRWTGGPRGRCAGARDYEALLRAAPPGARRAVRPRAACAWPTPQLEPADRGAARDGRRARAGRAALRRRPVRDHLRVRRAAAEPAGRVERHVPSGLAGRVHNGRQPRRRAGRGVRHRHPGAPAAAVRPASTRTWTTSGDNARRLYGLRGPAGAAAPHHARPAQPLHAAVVPDVLDGRGGLDGPALPRVLALHRRRGVPGATGRCRSCGRRPRSTRRSCDDGGRFVPSYSPENSPARRATGRRPRQRHDGRRRRPGAVPRPRAAPDDGQAPARATGSTATARWPSGAGRGWTATTRTGTPRTSTGCGTSRTRTCSTIPRCARRRPCSVRRRLDWWRDTADEMAFGLAQLGLAAAALGLADEAYECLPLAGHAVLAAEPGPDPQRRRSCSTPTSAAASRRWWWRCWCRPADNEIRLLPALPGAWPSGRISGVLLRGGIRVDELAWTAATGCDGRGPTRLPTATGHRRSAAAGGRRQPPCDAGWHAPARDRRHRCRTARRWFPTRHSSPTRSSCRSARPASRACPRWRGPTCIAADPDRIALKGTTGDGVTLLVEVAAAGEGVVRVRLSEDPDARSRSAAGGHAGPPGRATRPRRPERWSDRSGSPPARWWPRSASTRGACASSTAAGGRAGREQPGRDRHQRTAAHPPVRALHCGRCGRGVPRELHRRRR